MSPLKISLDIIPILTLVATAFIHRKGRIKYIWYTFFIINVGVQIFFIKDRYQKSQTILNLENDSKIKTQLIKKIEKDVVTLSLTAPKLGIDGRIIPSLGISYPSEFSDGIIRAGALINEGKLDEAYQIAEVLSKKKDDFGLAYYAMGVIELEKGNYSKGKKQLHRALELGLPKAQETSAYNNLNLEAIKLFNEGKLDEAYQIAEALSKKKDDFGPAYYLMGVIELKKGNYLNGEQQIHKALKLGLPKDQETAAYNNLFIAACKLFNEGKLDEAYKIAESLSNKKDDFGPAFFVMGTVEIEKGNYLNGEKQIHKALELGLPKDRETAAYNNLFTAANKLFSEGKLDEAYQIAEVLSQKKVDFGPAFFVMGSVENEKGNYLKAEKQIHKAIELGLSKYNEASAYHNLAIAALRQNKIDDAILILKQSLKSDTGFEESKILLKQLTRPANHIE